MSGTLNFEKKWAKGGPQDTGKTAERASPFLDQDTGDSAAILTLQKSQRGLLYLLRDTGMCGLRQDL